MPDAQTIEIAGQTWRIHPLEFHEQWEVECILLRIGGPALGHGLGAAIEGLAPVILELLKEEPPESLDLDGIMDFAKRGDERLRESWGEIADGLAVAVGGVARATASTMLERLDHTEVLRLGELALLSGKLELQVNGSWSSVRDWQTMSKCCGRDPQAKRELLTTAIRVTYSPETFGGEDDAGDA